MSDENEDVGMAECGSCRAIVPVNSSECSECGISFSGVSDEALGECGACNALVPLDSTKCPECGVVFVADDVVDILRTWMAANKMDVKTLFGRFDTNNDNMIDSGELREGLLSLNLADLPPSQVDRLVEAIDEDGDSLIDLKELQMIIGGEKLEEVESDDQEPEQENESLDYSENVLSKVMESNNIDVSQKEDFIAFAQDFNADDNSYLKKEELQAAAKGWNAKLEQSTQNEEEIIDEPAAEDVSIDEDEAVEEKSDEEHIEEDLSDTTVDDEPEDVILEGAIDEKEESGDDSIDEPTPEELFHSLAQAISAQGLTIREVFESMDTDLDGKISGPELQNGFESLLGEHLSATTIFAILGVLDEDKDGNIDPMELIQAIEALSLGIESDRTMDAKEDDAISVRTTSEIMEQLLEIIDEQDKSLANAFGDLDDDGNRMLSKDELISKLNSMLPDGLTEEEADELLNTMDTDGDGHIDMVEFVSAVERHEDEIATIEDEEAETVKTFPSEWQTRFMSKKWHDVFWPLIHASFSILIIGLLVNGLFPIVDGTGGMIELEIREDSLQTEWQMDDGTIVTEGEAYPCDPEIQEGKCKNSLTPLAGKASSMPGGFYGDAIVLMVLAGCGLIWSLYTHLILAPGWRARVKAMKDVGEERAEVHEAIEEEETQEDEDAEPHEEDSDETVEEEANDDEISEEEENEFDIGSFVGLEIDGEDYYGTIIEFDDEEGTVVIEEDETGDEIVGYQDEMFIPED